MKAILLAGGQGSRLRPLTLNTPKPIVPIFDRPFLRYQIELLKQVGVDCISDGYALSPYVCPLGLLWVPQQIGRFISLPFGTWTVCLHLNTWGSAEIGRFRDNISAFRDRIISLEQLRGANTSRRKNWCDGLLGTCFRTLRSLRA